MSRQVPGQGTRSHRGSPHSLCLCLGAVGVLCASEGIAQVPPEETPQEGSPSAESQRALQIPTLRSDLEEVFVTVDRHRKTQQNYAGTVSAFSEAQLTSVGVGSVQDMAQMVPGLQIGINNGGATIYLRGLGSDNTTEVGDTGVAVHADGVYLPRFRGMGATFLDVERVEVSSGPQSTYRGHNALGGAINVISRKPVFGEYQATAEATFGTFRQRAYQGMVNVPLGDSAALRIAANATNIDALWPNNGPLDHLPGAQSSNDYALKGSLRWEPSPNFEVTVAADYGLQRGTGWGSANVIGLLTNRDDAGTEFDLSDDFYAPVDPNSVDNPWQVFRKGRVPSSSLEDLGVRLSMTYDLGPVEVEFLASHRYQNWKLLGGSSVGPFASPEGLAAQQWDDWSYAPQRHSNSSSTVGELRIFTPENQRFTASLGLLGFYEEQAMALGQITADRAGGFNEFNMPSTINSSFAVQANATFHVTEKLRLVGGVRYTIDHKDSLGGFWMLGSDLPQDGAERCAEVNDEFECVELGLSSNDIGRFGTEGFRYRLLDRTNYEIPDTDATKEERVNFFFDSIEAFGTRDQTAIALCNDPPSVSQVPADSTQPAIQIGQDRLAVDNGRFRCAFGVRDAVPDNFANFRPQNGRVNHSYADFRAGIEYDLAQDSLLYATAGSAHKAGGFNSSLPDPNEWGGFLTTDYEPELVLSVEAGSKNLFLNRKMRINVAFFAYRYERQQELTIIPIEDNTPIDPSGSSILINPETGRPYPRFRGGAVGRNNSNKGSGAYGLDSAIAYALPLGLEANVHALIMNARLSEQSYVNDIRLGLASSATEVDLSGNWMPRVSAYTFNYHLSQRLDTSVGQFSWVTQGQTRGEHFMSSFNGDGTRFARRGPGWGESAFPGEDARIEADNPNTLNVDESTSSVYNTISQNLARLDDRVPTYTVVNFGIGWRSLDKRLSVRGFVNNLFNVAFANSITALTNNIRSYNNPRMAGVRVRMSW